MDPIDRIAGTHRLERGKLVPINNPASDEERPDAALIAFGDSCEETGFKPSHYYRLLPQIDAARARAKRLFVENVSETTKENP